MSTLLKREHAPITENAWQTIDSEAADVITQNLAARKIVDFKGPMGWDLHSINNGQIDIVHEKAAGGVQWGIRQAVPVVETRIPFELSRLELDNIERGSRTPELGPVHQAAEQIARFEDRAVFLGFEKAKVKGMFSDSSHKPQTLPKDPEQYGKKIADAMKMIAMAGVNGPYTLLLGPDEYFALKIAGKQGFPVTGMIKELTRGDIILCPAITGGALLSARGGDFELTSGVDFSIGFSQSDKDTVELYITESFAYRTLEPAAVIRLNPAAK